MPTASPRWTRLRSALAHAFTVRDEPLSAEQQQMLDRLATEVKRRRLVPVVAAGAELARPVAGVAGHSVTFFEPMLSTLLPPEDVQAAAELMRHPDAVDALQERLSQDAPPASSGCQAADDSHQSTDVDNNADTSSGFAPLTPHQGLNRPCSPGGTL